MTEHSRIIKKLSGVHKIEIIIEICVNTIIIKQCVIIEIP